MAERAARWTAAGCAAAGCVLAVGAALLARDLQGAPGVRYVVLSPEDLLIPLVYAITGAAVVWLRPRNAVGWILLGIGLCWIGSTFLATYGVRGYVFTDAGLPARQIALSVASWLWLPALFMVPTLLVLFYPGGQLPSPRWRLAVLSTVVGLATLAPAAAFTVDSLQSLHADARPLLVLPTGVQVALAVFGFGLLAATSLACIGNAAWRLWRADAPERAQLAWLLTTATTVVVLAFAGSAEWVFNLALVAVPVAVGVGVLRYGLLGIQVVLGPTLVYGLLTLLVALVFAGVTTVLSMLGPAGPLPTFVAAAVVAVGLVPAHARLRRFVGRLLDGPASDPLAAVSRVGRGVVTAGDHDPIPMVLASVAEAITAPYVSLRGAAGELIAARPADAKTPRRTVNVPLSYSGETLARLTSFPRPAG